MSLCLEKPWRTTLGSWPPSRWVAGSLSHHESSWHCCALVRFLGHFPTAGQSVQHLAECADNFGQEARERGEAPDSREARETGPGQSGDWRGERSTITDDGLSWKIARIQWEKKVEEGQKNFESVSKVLKKEVKKFEARTSPRLQCCSEIHNCNNRWRFDVQLQAQRAQEFKEKFVSYLESLMKLQQEVSIRPLPSPKPLPTLFLSPCSSSNCGKATYQVRRPSLKKKI